jgi:predicted ester cyclase
MANKAIYRRFHETLNTGDAALISMMIDEVIEPTVLFHTAAPGEPAGPHALKNAMATLLRAFPDMHVTLEDLIAEGDMVVGRQTVTGTHRGEYMGFPPTDKSVKYNEIFVLRFIGGRIAEISGVVDVLSLMKQLGTLPRNSASEGSTS